MITNTPSWLAGPKVIFDATKEEFKDSLLQFKFPFKIHIIRFLTCHVCIKCDKVLFIKTFYTWSVCVKWDKALFVKYSSLVLFVFNMIKCYLLNHSSLVLYVRDIV